MRGTMLVVKSIEVVEVNTDVFFVRRPRGIDKYPTSAGGMVALRDEQVVDMVKGRRFINQNGNEFCIGMTRQAQTALGVPFEAIDTMKLALEEAAAQLRTSRKDAEQQRAKVAVLENKINGARFWNRLKYLLTGRLS